MYEQFARIAADLGWGVERQIAVLEEFITGFGAGGRLDDQLRRQRLDALRRPQLVRDAMLDVIDGLGSRGAFSHFLHRKLRQAALEAKAAERTRAATPAIPRATARGRRWLPAWLRSRRPAAARDRTL